MLLNISLQKISRKLIVRDSWLKKTSLKIYLLLRAVDTKQPSLKNRILVVLSYVYSSWKWVASTTPIKPILIGG
jgi:hypothetical protein